ncbi:ATP-binding protein [Phytohabitans rumicis]|nr:ATP-binding protein [Phytohabitans rumicis]
MQSAGTTTLNFTLNPVVEAARQARALVTDACGQWHRPDLAESAHLAITELVNNVVAHARTPMRVDLALRDGELYIAVRDYSHEPPRPSVPTLSGGRGLLVVEGVARRWGCTPRRDGKVVWAVIGG